MKNWRRLLLSHIFGRLLLFVILYILIACYGAIYVHHTNVKVDACDRVGGTSVTEYYTGNLMCVTLEVIKL